LATSRDRSEPPVGSLVVRDLYRHFGDRWLVEVLFDNLLAWSRWWDASRNHGGLLCWGSNPYPPVFGSQYETTDVNNRQGAAYESGLDNSPMYDDIPLDAENHLMCLWDAGLNGLYIADCQELTELAGVFGRAAGVDRLMGLNARKGVAHTDTGLQPRQECSLDVAITHLAFKK
jgi:hypothetical protein